MNKIIGLQLIVYSLLLSGLSYFTHHLAPTLAQPTLIAGLAGGVLCLVWGLRAIAGSRGKTLPILTLILVSYVLLSQTVTGWAGEIQEVPGRRLAVAVTTLLLVFSLGMLMRIAYAGVVLFGGQPAGAPKDEGAKRQTTGGKSASQANGGKRA